MIKLIGYEYRGYEIIEGMEYRNSIHNGGMEDTLTESSLSRALEHNDSHDCGVVTASRGWTNCGFEDNRNTIPVYPDNPPKRITNRENRQRNSELKSMIRGMDYHYTHAFGSSKEGKVRVQEDVYFVVDYQDFGTLDRDLFRLGEVFDQDSILYMPKGSLRNEATPMLIGTNRCPNNFLNYGERSPFRKASLGGNSTFSTLINGRPFILEGSDPRGDAIKKHGNYMVVERRAERKFNDFMESRDPLDDDIFWEEKDAFEGYC